MADWNWFFVFRRVNFLINRRRIFSALPNLPSVFLGFVGGPLKLLYALLNIIVSSLNEYLPPITCCFAKRHQLAVFYRMCFQCIVLCILPPLPWVEQRLPRSFALLLKRSRQFILKFHVVIDAVDFYLMNQFFLNLDHSGPLRRLLLPAAPFRGNT